MKNKDFQAVVDYLINWKRENKIEYTPAWKTTDKSLVITLWSGARKIIPLKSIPGYGSTMRMIGSELKESGRVIKVKRKSETLAYFVLGDGFSSIERYDAERLAREMAEQLKIGEVHIEPFFHGIAGSHYRRV